LLWSWSSGWFDVQRTRVENEKKLVEVQTEALKVERSRLSRETEEQQKHVAALEREVATLRDTEVALTNQIARLERDRNEMRAAKQFFEGEARRLAGSETNALYLFTQLQTAQALREKLAGDNQKLQATNDALHITVAGQEALLRRATELLLQPALSLLTDAFSLEGAHSHFDEVLRWQADLKTAQNDREASSNVLNAITFYATNWPKAVKTRK
jgi:chromosome segregation ATPase